MDMKRNVRAGLTFAVVAVLALVMSVALMGCGSAKNKTKTDVTLVLDWTPNTNHTGFYVAQDKGYFADEGLNVTITQPPEDGATALVGAGKAQFGIDFQDYLAPAFATDSPLPVTTVATLIQHNTSGIITRQSANVHSPKDLEGKTYATWDLPVEQAMMKTIMTKDGGDFSKLVLVPSTVTDIVSALQSNIDAVWIYYAWDGIACETKGVPTNYFSFADIDPTFDYYTPVIVANNEFLASNPDAAKAFLRATEKGYKYAIAHPEEAAQILEKAAPELDKDIVLNSQKWLSSRYIDDAAHWGYIDQSRWDRFYDYLYQNQLVDKQIPTGYGFTNAYLPMD